MTTPVRLVGVAEIAAAMGISKQALAHWRAQRKGFPRPIAELKAGPVWDIQGVIAWAREQGLEFSLSSEAEEFSEKQSANAVRIAVTNMKGGVGKSTIAANIGWYFAYRKDKRVLLIDLDPQFNLSQYLLGSSRYEELLKKSKPMSAELFTAYQREGADLDVKLGNFVTNVRNWSDGGRLDVIPSKLELAYIQKHGDIKEHVLKDFVLDASARYDIMIIDCPPTDSVITNAAYLASDYLLVPVRPEFLSTIGLPLLAKALGEHKRLFRKETPPQVAGIVFNDVMDNSEHTRSRRFVAEAAKRLGWHVFSEYISHSNSYPIGARVNKPIFLTDYARWDKRLEFEAFADELAERIGL